MQIYWFNERADKQRLETMPWDALILRLRCVWFCVNISRALTHTQFALQSFTVSNGGRPQAIAVSFAPRRKIRKIESFSDGNSILIWLNATCFIRCQLLYQSITQVDTQHAHDCLTSAQPHKQRAHIADWWLQIRCETKKKKNNNNKSNRDT